MRASSPRFEPLDVWNQPETAVDSIANSPETAAVPAPFLRGRVYEVRGLRYWLILVPLALLLRLYFATLRVKVEGGDARAAGDTSRPLLGMIWHNRSLLFPLLMPRLREAGKMACLISPSKAAAWEVAFFRFQGIPAVRGSSSRRSIQATRELVRAFREGRDPWVSPDGPSGPLYEFKRGAGVVARLTRAPVLLFGVECDRAWRPRTWDRHLVPLPFSTVRVRARILEHDEVFAGGRDDAQAAEFLKQRLLELNGDPF